MEMVRLISDDLKTAPRKVPSRFELQRILSPRKLLETDTMKIVSKVKNDVESKKSV